MNDKICSRCKWIEKYEGKYICGYIAELYLIAAFVNPQGKCRFDFPTKITEGM